MGLPKTVWAPFKPEKTDSKAPVPVRVTVIAPPEELYAKEAVGVKAAEPVIWSVQRNPVAPVAPSRGQVARMVKGTSIGEPLAPTHVTMDMKSDPPQASPEQCEATLPY